jgi:hypothetical protein
MWNNVSQRRHRVTKVFPAQFQDLESSAADSSGPGPGAGSESGPVECEWMLFGDVAVTTGDGQDVVREWAGHAVVTQETEGERTEWKFRRYQVWLQLWGWPRRRRRRRRRRKQNKQKRAHKSRGI